MNEPTRSIGPYNLIRRIGRGAFGVVWLAERQSTIAAMQVALKLPRDEDIDLEAFKQEAVIWVHASGHANVVSLIDADVYDEQFVIVSEYVPDGSLASWLKRHGGKAPSTEAACAIIDGVLAGLAHLHERRIIHRDLKPDNILMQGDTPRLADFGIARLLRSGSYSSNVSGTWAYMAPEAFDGKRNERTDIWAVGVIFYQLLAGRLPYDQQDVVSLVGSIMRNDPPPLPELVPDVLRPVVERALRRDAAERYSSAIVMRNEAREVERMLWLKAREASELPQEPPLKDESTTLRVRPQKAANLPAMAMPKSIPVQTAPQTKVKSEAPRFDGAQAKPQETLKIDLPPLPSQVRPPPVQAPVSPEIEMSTAATVSHVFFEPGRVFDALKSKPRFLAASLILLVLSIGVTAILYKRIDMKQYMRKQMEKSQTNRDLTEEQKEAGARVAIIVGAITIPAAVPISIVIGALLYFVGALTFKGSIGYKKSLAVWVYSSLPPVVIGTILALFALLFKSPDSIDPERLLMTNPGAFMSADSPPMIVAALSQFDLLRLYGLILAAVGLRRTAKMSSAGAWSVVIGFWLLGGIIKTLSAALSPG